MRAADVLILGGGVTGTSLAYQLATRKAGRIVLLERHTVAAGATGRSSAIIRQHYSHELLALMALKSLRIFERFSEVVGGDAGFVRTGYLILVPAQDREALRQNVAMHQRVGVQTEYLDGEALRQVDPRVRTADAAAGAFESEAGYGDPAGVALAFAARARDLGVELRQGVTARALRVQGGRVGAVETSEGEIPAGVVVNACNAWANSVAHPGGEPLPIQAVRAQVCVFEAPARSTPHPVVADLLTQVYFRAEGRDLTLAGSIDPREFADVVDPDRYNEGVDPTTVETFGAAALRRFTFMEQARVRKGWAGVYDVTPDGQPMLGRWGGLENYYVAVGFSGHGFKLSPVVGMILADLITTGETRVVDVSPLAPDRFQKGNPLRARHPYPSLEGHAHL